MSLLNKIFKKKSLRGKYPGREGINRSDAKHREEDSEQGMKEAEEELSGLTKDLTKKELLSLDPEELSEEGSDSDEKEYEVVEREILPEKIICPDCGGITLEGLDFCDKCGGEL